MDDNDGLLGADQLIERILKASYGSGRIVVVSSYDWKLLRDAYGGNPLISQIAGRSLSIHPVMVVKTRETKFNFQSADEEDWD